MKGLSDFKGHAIEQIFLETQMGQVNDAQVVWKFGRSVDITTSTRDVWQHNSEYVFPSSASTLSVVSSGADTQEITIEGLDSDYNAITESINITGTTPVTTTNSFIRVNRAYNSNGTDLVGNVSISSGANLLAYIQSSTNQTLQAIYTVPSGYTAYLFRGMASTSKGKDAQITFKYRLFNKAFRVSETFGLYESSYEAERPFLPMPEKTDLKVSAISSSSGTDVSAQFGLLLMKNSTWKEI